MASDVQVTFRVDASLSAAFTEQVSSEHRPADQVMQDLMRDYLARARGAVREPSVQELELSQRLLREEAVDFARASVRLEGFTPSTAAEARAARFVAGDLGLAEFVNRTVRADEELSR